MDRGRAVGFAALVGLLCLLPLTAQAKPYGVNLILNGNAEDGPSSNTGAPVAVPSWTPSPAFTVVNYGAPGGFPTSTDPGPPDRQTAANKNFFAGGNAATSSATQEINLTANAADINTGKVTYDLSGWLGGFSTDGDNAYLVAEFFNGTTSVGGQLLGPVYPGDRNNVTGLFFRVGTGGTGPVPVNTTRVVVTLTMTRGSGGGNFNDGYADNLSLVLRAPFVVTTTDDSGAGSLRAAMSAGNTITFDPGVFAAASAPHIISLLSQLPPLNSNMTITGPGRGVLTVQRSTATGTLPFGIFAISNKTRIGPMVALSGLTISNGAQSGVDSFGGGILSFYGTVTLDNCAITGNMSSGSGGGIANVGGTLTLNSCAVTANPSQDAAGIYNETGTLTLNSCTVSGNSAGAEAGGILNGGTATIDKCTISGNSAHDNGGGLVNQGNASMTLTNCTISGNSAGSLGGGLANKEHSNATLTNCTFSGNSANSGGGVENTEAGFNNTAVLAMSNCTLSGNTAVNNGGGIQNLATNGPVYVTMSNCTLSGNSAGTGGGVSNEAATYVAKVTVDNTIFKKGTSGANIFNNSNGTITSFGFNMSSDNAGGSADTGPGGFLNATGDIRNIDPKLGPLQDNGGPTFTHALLAGSLAIDRGSSALTTDQRGAPRPVDDPNSDNGSGNARDIGAFEFQGTPPVVLANISGRLPVGTGDNALFAGFIVSGYQPKKVILRAIGPSLGVAGGLADPTLELRDGSGALLQSNDNWKDSPDKQAIIDSTIPPTNDLESAIFAILPASPSGTHYTAIVRGAGNATGIGVVEVYDLDRSLDSKLANISDRGFVQTGDNVLFAGNIVAGQVAQKVIIRAIGPSLSVPGAMADPTLELRDANGSLLEANDNWVDSPNKTAIIASTIPPTNNLESAIVRTLTPANYTAIVRGAGDTTGIAVVEVYALQ